MKHLKLFFALFAMLALGVGNAWGAEETFDWSSVTTTQQNPTSANVYTEGSVTLTFAKASGSNWPAENKEGSIRMYSNTTLTISCASGNITKVVFTSTGNSYTAANLKYNGTALSGNEWTLSSPANEVLLTASANARFKKIVVTYETASGGGETPGEGGGENSGEGEEPETPSSQSTATLIVGENGGVTWTNGAKTANATVGDVVFTALGSGSNDSKYYSSDKSWRFYTANTSGVKITTPEGSKIVSVIIKWKTGQPNTPTNWSKSGTSSPTTFTPNSGINTNEVSFTRNSSANFLAQEITVNYETSSSGSGSTETVVKTLQSIAVSGMTTKYETGDEFKFDGTCIATYSVTKNGEPQADETATVTPTSVSEPDMSTAGTKEITVTYTEGEITKTIPYSITVENALPKIVITQNEVAEFTNTYAEYTWTASGVSGKIYGYKNSGMQLNSSKDGSYVYNTDPIPGYIRKIKIVKAASGTTRNWTPYVSGTALTSADGTALEQKEVETTTTWEVDGETSYFYLLEGGGATVIESITISYEAVVPQVAAPTFDPVAGTYNAVQNVTISAEEGATIYYTLDGTTPSTESQVYSTPIEIAETKTLKAIAVKDEKVSPVASATYTIKLPLTTMDQIFAKATAVASTATSVEITFGNWVVSAVKEDGKTAFVTDGTKGFVIFDKDVNLGFSVGNTLSGTATCKVQLYNGFAELTELKSNTAGLSVGSGGTITTQELDATAIETLTGVNTGSLIKINGICSSTDSKYYVAGVQIYTALYDFETLKVGAEYNITGIYQQYHSTKEMLPRSAEDIEEVVGLPTATISIADITMEVGETKTIEATITPDAAQSTVQYAITAGREYITLDGTTITAIAAGTATITATIAEKADEYKGATKEFTVKVKPQNIAVLPFTFNSGKADIESTLGMSQTGLDDDYGSAPKLKFNGAGDNVIVHFDSQAGEFSFLLKQNGQNAGTFTVYESANGEDYTLIWSGGDFGNTQSETIKPTLSESARYVKFEYTTKGASTNYALGSISIAKPDNREEAGLAWSKDAVTLIVGETFEAPTLSNPKNITGITYESSNEDIAIVTELGIVTLVENAVGTTSISAKFAGDGNYKAAEVSYTITVKEVGDNCDGTDDFTTLAPNTSYGEQTTESGWIAKNAAVDTIGFIINGKTTAVGTITSPVLNGGIGSIKISYANTYKEDNGVSFQLEIKQNDAVVKTYTITKANADVVKGTVYTEVIEDINVAGDFQMVFTNLHPTNNSTSNKDRVSIGRLCWTGYEEETLVLTEGENNLTNGATGDVTVNRSFEQYKLYTLSLPFALSAAQVKTIFGTNTVLYQFAKLAKEGGDLVLYFSNPSAIAAATPYLIEPSQNVNPFVVEDATINTTATNISFTVDKTTITMKPVLSATETTTNGTTEYWLAADGYLYNNANELLSLRALFDITTIPGSGMPPRCRVALGENVETGVEDLFSTDAPIKVIENGQLIIIRDGVKYNVQGQKL